MTLIKLNWSGVKGEGTVKYTKEFTEAHIVVQLDMLQDCIIQLSERYAELGKRDAISAKIFYDFFEGIQGTEHMTHTINASQTAAVATDYYWIPIDENTPRGVKIQLLGKGGVAHYGTYHEAQFWTHWAPLPKRRD